MKTTVKSKGGRKLRLGPNLVLDNVFFVVFLAALGVLYINNSQRGERKLMEITNLENEVQEYRWEYMTLTKELMAKSSPSKLAEDLDGSVVFPKKGPRILKEPKS